ncbi:MAG: hypothetical protein U0X20_08750 [Caldilineaceae bacterium]
MVEALNDCIELSGKCRKDEDCLSRMLRRRIMKVAPEPYRRYRLAYKRQPLYFPIETQLLSHWQWRTYAAELAELAGLAELFDTPAPGDQEEALRSALFLAPGEASTAPYQALLAAGESVDPAPQARDGNIDAAIYCAALLDECFLTVDEYKEDASLLMYWLWPQDYLRYSLRYFHHYHAHKGEENVVTFFPWPRSLEEWRWNVAALAEEVARCEAAGEGPSPRWHWLSEWLLLTPQAGVPSLDWHMPPTMADEPGWLEEMSRLA